MKQCSECSKLFPTERNRLTCSDKCSYERKKKTKNMNKLKHRKIQAIRKWTKAI